ncbi:nuclease [Curtobacterium sp. MCLR17_051]|nr:nuclease [Curtobacterium sp. MCLR17_053]PZF48808.1 nuclease [Curtobacterium sp. MCLR17_051]
MVVVGRAGVFIVDTKAWREVAVHGDRIVRGQEDVTDDIARLADLAYSTEAALADTGLAPGEVHAVAALAGQKRMHARVASVDVIGANDLVGHITKRGARLSASRVDEVFAAILHHFPVLGDGGATPPQVVVPAPVLPREPDVLLPTIASTDDELTDQLLHGVLEAPIEDWMAFLDPAQATLVRRSFNGPARIRGAAGTGKTVVGLHRAAYLARATGGRVPFTTYISTLPKVLESLLERLAPDMVGLHRAAYLARATGGRVLFTTYISTLPKVLESLLERLAPDMVGRVDFMGVHAFATRLLKERGIAFRAPGREAQLAFDDAWNAIRASSPLRSSRFSRSYWEDEISHVIKGRGLTRFDEYADLARIGRKHALPLETRQAVWDLYEAYARGLRERRAHDWQDIVLLARDAVRAVPLERYDAVIVDEAQDLSCAMVALVHQLVGDRTDGLTLIGDGQQTIYPGGYTLGEVGINLSGRGVVLDVNHRNTAEILEFAKEMVADDQFVDIEGVDGVGDAVSDVSRSGAAPTTTQFASRADHDRAMLDRLTEVLRLVGTGHGDVGILTATNRQADDVMQALASADVPTVSLQQYAGRSSDAVRVGTVKRAKGLEFKQVLLAHVDPRLLDAAPAEPSETERERRERGRRELYVGMTRARDGLWVGARSGATRSR